MKTYLFLATFFSCFFFSSCEEVYEHQAIRRLVNETQYPVKFRAYGDDVEYKYQIDPYGSIDIQGECYTGLEKYCDLGWTSNMGSAEIIFDDKVILRYEGLPPNCKDRAINGDPTGTCFGYVRSDENGILVYTYTITEEDYESAEPISGN